MEISDFICPSCKGVYSQRKEFALLKNKFFIYLFAGGLGAHETKRTITKNFLYENYGKSAIFSLLKLLIHYPKLYLGGVGGADILFSGCLFICPSIHPLHFGFCLLTFLIYEFFLQEINSRGFRCPKNMVNYGIWVLLLTEGCGFCSSAIFAQACLFENLIKKIHFCL